MSRLPAALLAAAALLAFAAPPAAANHHLMKVREVFAGASGRTNAQFVELQMYGPGQNVLAGHRVEVYDAAGTVKGSFAFSGNVPSGANQASVLVATTDAAAFFGVTPDLTMTPVLSRTGGKACFISNAIGALDCVSWGSYSGSAAVTGTPFGASGGIPLGKSIVRDISAGTPTVLEPADDTNDSAADFDAALPSPRTNAGATTTTAGTATAPSAADGATFSAALGTIRNVVTVNQEASGQTTFRDTGAPVDAALGCTGLAVNVVRCVARPANAVLGAEGNDTLAIAASVTRVSSLSGGPGNDRLTGGVADDALEGDAGADTLDGAGGGDELDGGDGVDTVTYAGRSSAVLVDLDGVSGDDGGGPDGTLGQRDTVTGDTERVVGGNGPDTLTGDGDANRLTGGPGADRLRGGAGPDALVANDGVADSVLDCGAGTDSIIRDAGDPAGVGCENVTTTRLQARLAAFAR